MLKAGADDFQTTGISKRDPGVSSFISFIEVEFLQLVSCGRNHFPVLSKILERGANNIILNFVVEKIFSCCPNMCRWLIDCTQCHVKKSARE